MHEEIEIIHCSLCLPLDRDEVKYQTDIMATNCNWKERADSNHSLQESPVAGQAYFVTLNQPVKFWLNMELWLYYDSPLVSLNGYETEQEVEQSTFCYGQIVSIISQNELGATVQFKVNHALTFQDILTEKPVKQLPEFWTDFYVYNLERDEYAVTQLGNYFQLSLSAQGDVGLSCILKEVDNHYYICKMIHWSFSEEYTFGGKYILPESIKEKVPELNF